MRVMNMGAFRRLPVYRAKPLFRGLGQFDDPFEMPADELVAFITRLAAFDSSDFELGYSYIFPNLELSVWRPDKEQPYFSTIGIGCRGYYKQCKPLDCKVRDQTQ